MLMKCKWQNAKQTPGVLHYVLRILFPASNNVTEYEACLHGIRLAVKLGVKRLYVHGDSALVINQLNMEWDTTHEKMDLYCKEIRKWESNFYGIEYIHVVRDRKHAADVLSKLGSSRAQIPQGVFVQDIHAPSVGTDMVENQPNEAMLINDTTPPPTTMIGAFPSSSTYRMDRVFKIERRTSISSGGLRITYWLMVNLCKRTQVLKCCSNAYPKMTASSS